ncbi:hypothetical protein EJ04DRAFT_604165 [Polyplosphaeria fusca]|uniref:Uncharacterized protein n=1 Tax=Polyplosphaeria fusca TaxID=682080 RepID=A0A9P4QZ58_9PLEO|nr:hypothetical protein EJ04DRAFT_604165 [Polyplosphaeria fusca]
MSSLTAAEREAIMDSVHNPALMDPERHANYHLREDRSESWPSNDSSSASELDLPRPGSAAPVPPASSSAAAAAAASSSSSPSPPSSPSSPPRDCRFERTKRRTTALTLPGLAVPPDPQTADDDSSPSPPPVRIPPRSGTLHALLRGHGRVEEPSPSAEPEPGSVSSAAAGLVEDQDSEAEGEHFELVREPDLPPTREEWAAFRMVERTATTLLGASKNPRLILSQWTNQFGRRSFSAQVLIGPEEEFERGTRVYSGADRMAALTPLLNELERQNTHVMNELGWDPRDDEDAAGGDRDGEGDNELVAAIRETRSAKRKRSPVEESSNSDDDDDPSTNYRDRTKRVKGLKAYSRQGGRGGVGEGQLRENPPRRRL